MERQQLFFLLLCVSVLKGDCRYIQDNELTQVEFLPNADHKRELGLPDASMYRRPLRCLDMVALEGQFTFIVQRPQLGCAAFFIAEPNMIISVHYDNVDIDCRGGDFIKVFDGWVMMGEKFPSSRDHPLPLSERYVDYCESSRRTVHSSQNVLMVFFHIFDVGSSFTITVQKHFNPFPCNIISQTPEGSFTMVIPQQQRNCSFSILYPVELQVSEFSLKHGNNLPKRSVNGCAEAGDFVELLGGNGLDTTKMFSIADLCTSSTGPTHMKIGCDNTVLRMVSSGKFVNRLSFSYNLLDQQELQRMKLKSMDNFCFNN